MMIRTAIMAALLCLCITIAALALLAPDRLTQIKPGLSVAQVEAILGRPASIEQSQSTDQTISGEVDHYPFHFPARSGESRVIYVNHIVFKTQFLP